MKRFVGVVGVAVAVAACGSSSGGGGGSQSGVTLMAGFDPGPAPDPSQGFQIVLPIVKDIPAGSSQEYCSWTNLTLPQDVWISASQGAQTETGHHVVLYYAPNPQKVDTRLCANEDMAEFKFGMPASGGSTGKVQLPSNLAVHLPAGAQIVVNHHYLNASATDVAEAQSAINVYYADPNVPHVSSSTVVVLDSSLTVPVGASSVGIDCTFNDAYAAWDLIPHMHAWGSHITVDHTTSTGTTRLFDVAWDPNYSFDFQSVETKKDPSAPYMFQKGDKMHIQCDYMNTTSGPMSFGSEMCVFIAFTVDPNNVGNLDCDRGQWGKF
jgi:hypothetical protein